MTGHKDRNFVTTNRPAYRPGGYVRYATPGRDLPGDLAVGHGLPVRDRTKDLPYLPLKSCAYKMKRYGEIRLPA